jgi:hypothetical protein
LTIAPVCKIAVQQCITSLARPGLKLRLHAKSPSAAAQKSGRRRPSWFKMNAMLSGIQYGLTRAEYLSLRAPYVPNDRKIVFVLESPPKSGLYFYNPRGRISEPLFSAMMKDVLEIKPESKDAGLREFARQGCLLLDATYTPVNHDEFSSRDRNQRIMRDLPVLVDELHEHVGPATRVVLVKVNICELLEPALINEGFPVVNRGTRIPFPSNGQQGKFREMVRRVLG